MFSAPLWLYGLATLAIPLALHLWSRRPRSVIRVGSLRHVTELAEARSWSARLTDRVLLALRLALLACVVLGLAGPRLGPSRSVGTLSRLVLVEPDLLRDSALIQADPLLDSLARSRATIRLLAPGLPRLQLDGVRSQFRGPSLRFTRSQIRTSSVELGTLWDLLASADYLVSPGGQLIVIARPRVSVLGGRRPMLRARVTWHAPAPPTAETWAAARWLTTGDSLVTLTGHGDALGVSYHYAAGPAHGKSRCAGCIEPRPLAVLVRARDSTASQRVRLASMAVASLLGQQVGTVGSVDSADLILTTARPSDSLFSIARPVVSLDPSVVASPALADTVLAHWPWQPLGRDRADPRETSVAQALPAKGLLQPAERRDARVPLLLFGLVLFCLERWLATQGTRRRA
jgi:hypothetical protein